MSRSKKTGKAELNVQYQKKTAQAKLSNEEKRPVWTFENIDKDGKFRFDPGRVDFNCCDFLTKMLAFSSMTWSEIKKQTHDNGKSKHHFLDARALSKEAEKRIETKGLIDVQEYIYSFALNNTVRVLGIRYPNTDIFSVVWYDANHEFSISFKKHT